MQLDPLILIMVLVISIKSDDSSKYVLLYEMRIGSLGLVEQFEYLMKLMGGQPIEFISIENMMNHGFEFLRKLLHGLLSAN